MLDQSKFNIAKNVRGTICHAALLPRCSFEKFIEGVIVKITFISKLNEIKN